MAIPSAPLPGRLRKLHSNSISPDPAPTPPHNIHTLAYVRIKINLELVNTVGYVKPRRRHEEVTAGTDKRRSRKDRLTRDDWVEAACESFSTRGPEGVKVEPLAKKLAVTKGSFYWHFKDRSDLLKSVLGRWEREETLSIIEAAKDGSTDPRVRLLDVFKKLSDLPRFRLETHVRYWARHDKDAASRIAKMEKERIAFFSDLFLEMGLNPQQAELNARICVATWTGFICSTSLLPDGHREAIVKTFYDLLARSPESHT